MRLSRVHARSATLIALALGLIASPVRGDSSQTSGLEHPLNHSQLVMRGSSNPNRRSVVISGKWSTTGTMFNPSSTESTLRVVGKEGEDSGRIALRADRWRALAKGRGFKYTDKTGAAGGIRSILLRSAKKGGGSIKIVGGGANWRYALGQEQTGVTVTFAVGSARWCAEFESFQKNLASKVQASADQALASCPCDGFASTWEAIQASVFARHGCTEQLCHGAAVQGGLSLDPATAYSHLVDVPSTTDPKLTRVSPGEQKTSMLWLKLAKGTLGESVTGPVGGAAMPNTLPPISSDELDAIRLWIRAGAPQTGVVRGTDTLLGTCLPPSEPIKIRPPAVPAQTDGVQLSAPPWKIKPHGESEVCYATWYDFSATIPAGDQAPCPDYWGGPSKQCFFYNRDELTQDPNSHHSIIHLYKGAWDIAEEIIVCNKGPKRGQRCMLGGNECGPNATCVDKGSAFGPFQCLGGANEGQTCDPKGAADQCPGGGCAGRVQSTVACIGYGPPDYGFDISGLGSDNAPAFGGSQQPFFRRDLAPGVFQMLPVKGTVVWNSHAFNLTDEEATNQQYQNLYFAPPSQRVFYGRGIFDSRNIFVQNVPPFQSREYCKTMTMPKGSNVFEMSSHNHKRGVLFRAWGPGIATSCSSQAGDVCEPESTQPILTSTDYSDPDQPEWLANPVHLVDDDPATRRYKFCCKYDNGESDPTKVKRQSTSPPTPFGALAPGGPCQKDAVACLDGPHKGELCNGDSHACDSSPGANDGVCDACPLRGGVTTEDEMFILLGSYYCDLGSDCETQAPGN